MKLTRLQLLSFRGKLCEWQSFWEQFSSAVHDDCELSRSEEFQYLRHLLTEPASTVIAGIQATAASYDEGVEVFMRRFNNK